MDIFEKRVNLKPYEYPQLIEYVDAIRHSYWLHTEFNYTSDIQDYRVNVTEAERGALTRSLLAIAQIEVAVKTFWGDIFKKIPKPEVGAVGFTFAESEVRHMDAYSHLIEILGLNEQFEGLTEVPAIQNRIKYLDKILEKGRSGSTEEYAQAIVLFALFIEHVSLFSQFLIIMSFNKHKNLFKGISNAVEATSKEEQIHGMFGIDLINIIKGEHPEWFGTEYSDVIREMSNEAYAAEMDIVDWIFSEGELDFLPKADVEQFIRVRMSKSLESLGIDSGWLADEEAVARTGWFTDEILTTKHVDFFHKRSIGYSKRTSSVTGAELFD